MNAFWCGYASLVHIFICVVLAVFVALKNPKRALNVVFACWVLSSAFWSFGYFSNFISSGNLDAFQSYQISLIGAAFFPSFFLHLSLIQLKQSRKKKPFILAFYVLSFVIVGITLFGSGISSVEPRFGLPALPTPALGFHLFAFAFIASLAYVLMDTLVQLRASAHAKPVQRKLNMAFWGALIAHLGVSVNFLVVYGLPTPLILNVVMSFYVVFIAYAVLRYRLWRFEYMLRKLIVFSVLCILFAGVYIGALYSLRFLVGSMERIHEILAAILAFFVGYSVYKPMNASFSDQAIFRKKYDYQKILKDASRGMSKIKSLEHLLKLIVHFITMKMRVENAAVLSQQKDTGNFRIECQRGYGNKLNEMTLDKSDALVDFLNHEREAIDSERVRDYIAGEGKKALKKVSRDYDFEKIQATMQRIGADCCIPSFLGRDLKNILILGEKKSGDFYTEADLTILYTLAQESAIAIENAGLYDEALTKTDELAQINEQLEYSKSLLMKALNETEVANKQLQDTQAQLIHEQKMATLGRLAASVGHEVNNPLTILSMNVSRAILKYRKNPDLRVGEILELFQKMEQNIGRIKAVVNTLTGLLKRSEKGKFEPLSLKLILEETLPLVQFQTYLDNLTGTEVEFDIPGNIPLVRGDLERLQEVFLNLFINAYHAMTGKRNRRIQVKAAISTSSPRLVEIRFNDNGSGMNEETMKKIFNYGFTTKPPGRGSGLGLYMCKYIIELHGGSMHVESELGVGTTFVLCLPIYEEESTGSGGVKVEASN